MLDVSGDNYSPHKFTGGIPSEWGALANLKELKMDFCGLDGKLLSIRTGRLRIWLIFLLILHEYCLRLASGLMSSENLPS